MKPLVSVIMPAYNAEKYIAEAIESIIGQTYENWELIIVEDGSTDATESIISSYLDARIVFLRNSGNKGIAYSTNRGLDVARGKYIALLDDDDIALPDRLSLQVDFLEQHDEIDVLGGMSIDIDENGKKIRSGGVPRNNPKYIRAVLLIRCMDFHNGTVMYRNEFIKENNIKYRENCYGMQDYKFYIECSKVGNISTIDEYLLKYRVHSNNETTKRRLMNSRERAELYALFREESLAASGFELSQEDFALMHRVMAEFEGKCANLDELYGLYEICYKLVKQGREMRIDYQDELEAFFRNVIVEKIRKLSIFE